MKCEKSRSAILNYFSAITEYVRELLISSMHNIIRGYMKNRLWRPQGQIIDVNSPLHYFFDTSSDPELLVARAHKRLARNLDIICYISLKALFQLDKYYLLNKRVQYYSNFHSIKFNFILSIYNIIPTLMFIQKNIISFDQLQIWSVKI